MTYVEGLLAIDKVAEEFRKLARELIHDDALRNAALKAIGKAESRVAREFWVEQNRE